MIYRKIYFSKPLTGFLVWLMAGSCWGVSCQPRQADNKKKNMDSLFQGKVIIEQISPHRDTSLTMTLENREAHTVPPDVVKKIRVNLERVYLEQIARTKVPDSSRYFAIHEFDLNNDGKKEIFVGFKGAPFCRPGQCTVYLFSDQGKQINEFECGHAVVEINNEKRRGWHEIQTKQKGNAQLFVFNGMYYSKQTSSQHKTKKTPVEDVFNHNKFNYQWNKF
jgi:hypothetical protein